MNLRLHVVAAVLAIPSLLAAQHHHGERAIEFPDVPGYQTLAVDLHMHTVFSDGDVWPNIRVQEATRDGIDAIAVTDHIEYQPHSDDIPHPDRNRSYDIAVEAANDTGLLVIRGSEITRSMPHGHANAVFLEDANPLILDDPMDVFHEAKRQGAFTFWNHPMWLGQRDDGVATLTEIHRELIVDGLLHGIEVVNFHDYSDEALQIALDNNLTIVGTSDIHNLIDWEYEVPMGGHRPVTLVFATERTQDSIKEALFAGRTTVWFENLLVGREEYLVPLLQSSLSVSGASYDRHRSVLTVAIKNDSDARYILDNKSGFTLHQNADVVTIEPQETTLLRVKTLKQMEEVELRFEVLNAVTAPDTHPEITLVAKAAR